MQSVIFRFFFYFST
ncbi:MULTISPECIES: pheST operon leader peptide PheM [Yersinia]